MKFIATLLVLTLFVLNVSSSNTTIMLPMRDGVKLNTRIFIIQSEIPTGTILLRTPYGVTNLDYEQIARQWINRSFNCVFQDFRGFPPSEGVFRYWEAAAEDGYDTMEWIANQKWSNKKIFSTGDSAPGIAAYLESNQSPPWLKGQSIGIATSNLHSTIYQNGAAISMIEYWTRYINQPQESLTQIYDNEAHTSYWENQEITNWTNVNIPALHYTGWYDLFFQGQSDAFVGYQNKSSAPGKSFFVIGPGGHCIYSENPWPNGNLTYSLVNEISTRMFVQLNKSDDLTEFHNALADIPTVHYYIMGPGLPNTVGNVWATSDTYPPVAVQPLEFFLSTQGWLEHNTSMIQSGNETFLYNPTNPVPTVGGANAQFHLVCGPNDQSSLYNRSDIISFISETLTDGIFICGRMEVILYVSSNASDTDFTAKLVDVFPDGRNMLIQDGIIRMKWRENSSVPVLMNNGTIYEVSLDLWSICYVFNPGHKLRLDISSSNAPRFIPNPNNGLLINQTGPEIIAENTIHFGDQYPSRLILPKALNQSINPIPTPTPTSTPTPIFSPTPIPTSTPSTPIPTSSPTLTPSDPTPNHAWLPTLMASLYLVVMCFSLL